MGDDKIDEIRREHFGVSDDEAMGADEVSDSLQKAMDRADQTAISPPPSFPKGFGKKVVRVLSQVPPLRAVPCRKKNSLDMSWSEHVSKALAAHRRVELAPLTDIQAEIDEADEPSADLVPLTGDEVDRISEAREQDRIRTEDTKTEPLGTDQDVVIHAKPDGKSRSPVTVNVSPDGVYEMTWGWEPVRRVFGVKGGDYMRDYEEWGVYPPQDNASQLGAEQAEADEPNDDLDLAKVAIEDAARAHWQQVFDEGGSSDDPTDDGLTECFDCGNPTQRSGLFAEADVYCDECADKHQNEKREQERIRLVDGYPGEWEWTGEMWKLTIYCDMTTIDVTVEDLDGYWSASLLVGEALDRRRVEIVEATGMRKTIMEAAAAIRPHAEAMVKVLEGMGDE